VNLVAALKNTGYFGSVRGSSRLRRALVVAEVTITVMLLAGMTILARGAVELARTGPGFDASRVINLRIDPVRHIGRAAPAGLDIDTVQRRFAAVNGVEAVAIGDGLLGTRTSVTISATGDFAAREERRISVNHVGGEYFRAVGLRLIEGRDFEPGDDGAAIAVVSEIFARQQFPSGGAVGRALRIGPDPVERTIVGVVSNVLLDGIRRQPSPIVYVPASPTANGTGGVGFLVGFTPGAHVLRELQRALADVDPLQTMTYAMVLQDALAAGALEVRFTVYLAGPVILLALALTMSGIYGVLAQAVAQRTHEVALRVALGAEGRDVLGLIALQGLKLTMVGAVAGAAGALAVDRLVGTFVLGVPGDRPTAITVAAITIITATLAASVVPCLRAMRIDPATVLRYE
jgi:ABC-type antimicrobial peptide transport system permease subunit